VASLLPGSFINVLANVVIRVPPTLILTCVPKIKLCVVICVFVSRYISKNEIKHKINREMLQIHILLSKAHYSYASEMGKYLLL
jgi:hypothetical protein